MSAPLGSGWRPVYAKHPLRIMIRRWCWTTIVAMTSVLMASTGLASAEPTCDTTVRIGGSLPLPCTMRLADYERVLYTWINDRAYTRLDWARDKHVRDTGPFVLGALYGTHPAVRIYYSPEVHTWLLNDRQGELPVGSMIVKEMFNPPAARYEERRPDDCVEGDEAGCAGYEAMLQAEIGSWTIMIRDDQTKDGWFWAGASRVDRRGKTADEYAQAIDATLTTNAFPFDFRDSDHGQASCLRCHATAASESTFSALENIEARGLQFRVDNSWRTDLASEQRPGGGLDESTLFLNAVHGNSSAATTTPDGANLVRDPLPAPHADFLRYFSLGQGVEPPATAADVEAFPGQWADHVPAGPEGAEQFITADNCIGCHGGLGGAPYGVTMFLQTGPAYGDGYNISPFGEWRWSPMGLAGRDPAFFSQVATELAILDQDFDEHPERFEHDREVLAGLKRSVINTCLSCHGAMGQRQLLIDSLDDSDLEPDFKREYVDAFTPLTRDQESPLNDRFHKYGNLAREGISCAVCHHIDPPEPTPGTGWSELENFLMTSTTGQFRYSPPDEINGPFADVQALPMENALGITPVANDYIKDSQLCGTCHTINLPNVDATHHEFPVLDESAKIQAARLKETYAADYAERLTRFPHSIEQATFLEWQNSAFATDEESFQSCQDCHMSNSFHSLDGSISIEPLTSQIASIQDASYPEVAHSLPPDELDIPFRDDYRRHDLVGLNVFLLEMFDQFDPILGVAETDYMTSASTGNRLAIEEMLRQGRDETVTLEVDIVSVAGSTVTADVTVTNLVGHRFPSGVGFRRAWIEMVVLDDAGDGEVVWASGRTNDVGLIVEGVGDTPLPTEFFENNQWQPHFHGIPGPKGQRPKVPAVTAEHQVQIYEEVVLDGEDDVTFSFIHRDAHVKDNRLLPKGWQFADTFDGEILQQFMEATDPKGVQGDPDYIGGPDFPAIDRVRYEMTLPAGVDPTRVTVRARMIYQAFQPFWFKRKFELSPHSPDTQRLFYLASHLATEGTVIDDWKLPLVSASASSATIAP